MDKTIVIHLKHATIGQVLRGKGVKVPKDATANDILINLMHEADQKPWLPNVILK